MAASPTPPGSRARSGARFGALRDLAVALPVALAAGAGTSWVAGLPANYLLWVLGAYALLAGVVAARLPASGPGPGIGAANRVTLGRAALATPVFALALRPMPLDPPAAWWAIGLSTVVLILDGLDGRVARRSGTETAFGARFDMEVDAALILALSALVWGSGRVGAWVLLIGAMRYLFVAAGRVWSQLRSELPPSLRRKVVCVVQAVVLLVALGPIIPAPMAIGVSALGLLALIYSFGVDVRWAFASVSGRGRTSSVANTG